MIALSTGAILDKDMESGDFTDGRRYGPRVGLCETFIPCRFCSAERCRRVVYEPCIKEYEKLWTARFTQRTLEGWR